MIRIHLMRAALAAVLSLLLVTGAAAGHSNGRRPSMQVNEWWVYTEINLLPDLISPRSWYRLANEKAAQLKYDGENSAVAGIYWGGINANTNVSYGAPDVRFSKLAFDPNAGDPSPKVSQNIQLNEAIAIYVKGGGYLIYDKHASKLKLGWQSGSRFNPFTNSPDIYQWRFRNESPRRSDHRRRDLKEKQTLALYNTVAKAYLVHGRSLGLRWEKE